MDKQQKIKDILAYIEYLEVQVLHKDKINEELKFLETELSKAVKDYYEEIAFTKY
jgi:hypothetical protein